MRKVSFRVPDELYDEVMLFADGNGSAFSDVVRLALINLITSSNDGLDDTNTVSQASLFKLLGLTQVIVEQLDTSSVRRAHDIALALASKHGLQQSDLAAVTSLHAGGKP